jgi:penicillin-binding protein 1A
MKKCYADETLNISKEDFEEPEDLSINISCGDKAEEEGEEKKVKTSEEEETDF